VRARARRVRIWGGHAKRFWGTGSVRRPGVRAHRLSLGSHVSNPTVAAHGCDSAIDDVVCDAVRDPGGASGWRLAIALYVRVPVGDDDRWRMCVEHVVVQANNVVTNRRRTADFITSLSHGPGDIGGVVHSKITAAGHHVKVMIDCLLRLLEGTLEGSSSALLHSCN